MEGRGDLVSHILEFLSSCSRETVLQQSLTGQMHSYLFVSFSSYLNRKLL
ncbi:hypothetical protein HanRHA438_Chr03g0130551 [Helianthus annuus]|nr:hypothetical protein HanRHA438_Chr03g0130551 [Helianthus annuus]